MILSVVCTARTLKSFHSTEVLMPVGSYTRTPEIRAKIAAAQRGRKHTAEHRAKNSAANMGHPVSAAARAAIAAAAYKHGMIGTGAYKSWCAMLARCRSQRPNYSGRGISVCERWDPQKGGSFVNFYADMGDRPEDRTIDRIGNDGNYEPSNCRWATTRQQLDNRGPYKRKKAAHASEARP